MSKTRSFFIKIVFAPCQTAFVITHVANLLSPYRFLEANMKLLLFLLAVFIVCVDVEGAKCPPIIWGCRGTAAKKSYNSKHQHTQLKLRLQRDAPSWRQRSETKLEDNGPCAPDDSRCLAKTGEPWELTRQRLNDDAPNADKRQANCPFGVWGCKKRRVQPKRSTRSDNSDMNDFINELFAESWRTKEIESEDLTTHGHHTT